MTIAASTDQLRESDVADLTTCTEPDLLAKVRGGDVDAFGELWVRHERVALAVARRSSSSDPDDLVAEAFARILRAMRSNSGPNENFRAYLCATIKSCAVDEFRQRRGTISVDDVELVSEPEIPEFPSERSDEAVRAWECLNEQEQWLLWASAVEGYSLSEISDRIQVKPGTAAVRLFRARERLRAAFLDRHVPRSDNAICQQHRDRFAAYVRDTVTPRRRAALEAHLDECVDCAAALAGVGDVNRRLRVVIVPLLSVAAVRRLAAQHAGAHAPRALVHHAVARVAAAKAGAATVAAVAVTVAAVTGTVVLTQRQGERPAVAAPAVTSSLGLHAPAFAPATVRTPDPTATTGRPSAGASAPSTASAATSASSASGSPAVTATPEPAVSTTPGTPPHNAPLSPGGGTTAGTTSAGVTRSGAVVSNPGFEDGSTGWTSNSSASVFWNDGGYAHSGSGYAWMDGQPVPHTETLSQTVVLPSVQHVTFTYWLKIATAHTSSTPVDTLTLTANGTTVQSFSNADVSGYAQRTVDLSAYAGRSVTLTWTGVQATSTGTSFFIDDVAFAVA